MMANERKLKEVQSVITSLLAARKSGNEIDMIAFDRIYADCEEQRIPFRSFGYSTLAEFLRTIPEVDIQNSHGKDVILFAGKKSTNHLTQLVDRQRSNKSRYDGSRSRFRPIAAHYMNQPRRVSPLRRNNEICDEILNIVKQNPKGLSRNALLRIHSERHAGSDLDNVKLSGYLKSLEARVMVRDSMIFPMRNPRGIKTSMPRLSSLPRREHNANVFTTNNNNVVEKVEIAKNYKVVLDSDGDDVCDYDDFSFDYVTCTDKVGDELIGYATLDAQSKQTASNYIEESVTKTDDNHLDKETLVVRSMIESQTETPREQTELDKDNSNFSNSQDHISAVLNDRVQFRLQKLIQNYPNGIWCIDLPKKYREEYNISLEWENLGFQHIGNFAAHLPHIFHMVGPFSNSDYRLYDAKVPPPTDAERNVEKQKRTAASLYKVYDSDDDEIEAVPANIPLELSNQISPDDVMANGESVGQISVTTFKVFGEASAEDLQKKVRVVEAFSPSFFWIQIEKKIRKFEEMMNSLHTFYETQKAKYAVPIIMLEKGLNIAVMYFGKWHRGIIKAVDPNCQVTVLFYDYGTVKSYSHEHIFYLHRNFSALPAQAIPCGLYNVKPSDGEEWSKDVIDKFIKRVHERLLWAVIGSIDIETNSMLISLTDTSGPIDFHISDWMFDKNMAVAGHMVRIRIKNFVNQHHLQCNVGLQRKNNLISYYNVENDSRLSSINNSMRSDERRRQKIENSIDVCPTSAEIPKNIITKQKTTTKNCNKPNILRSMLRNLQNKLSNESSSVHSSIQESNVDDNTKMKEISQDMRDFMNDEIIVDDTLVENSVDYDVEKSSVWHPRYETLIPLANSLPEKIPEFGTFASPLGGHGRMEPIDWSIICAKGMGKHVEKYEPMTPISSRDKEKSPRSPSLKDIQKPIPKLKPSNKRFDEILNTYHDKLQRDSPLILKPEGQVAKSSIITLMVRRTLNDIDGTFNDHDQLIIPDEIRTLLENSSTVVSSENEITGWDSPGDARSYVARKLSVEQDSNDSLCLDHQRTKEGTEKVSENHHTRVRNNHEKNDKNEDNKNISSYNINGGEQIITDSDDTHPDGKSIRSGTTNSVYYASPKNIMLRFRQLLSANSSTSCSDNHSVLDSDDSMCSKIVKVVDNQVDEVKNVKYDETLSDNENEKGVIGNNESSGEMSSTPKTIPPVPVLNDEDLLSDSEEFDCFLTEDYLQQIIPDHLRSMLKNASHEGPPNGLHITEIDSDEDEESHEITSKLDTSTDVSTPRQRTRSISSRPDTDSDSQRNYSTTDPVENKTKITLQNKFLNNDRDFTCTTDSDLDNSLINDDDDDYNDEDHDYGDNAGFSSSQRYAILQTIRESGLHNTCNLSGDINLSIDLESFMDN